MSNGKTSGTPSSGSGQVIGKFGAGKAPAQQVRANANNNANMQNPTSPVHHAPGAPTAPTNRAAR